MELKGVPTLAFSELELAQLRHILQEHPQHIKLKRVTLTFEKINRLLLRSDITLISTKNLTRKERHTSGIMSTSA